MSSGCIALLTYPHTEIFCVKCQGFRWGMWDLLIMNRVVQKVCYFASNICKFFRRTISLTKQGANIFFNDLKFCLMVTDTCVGCWQYLSGQFVLMTNIFYLLGETFHLSLNCAGKSACLPRGSEDQG